MDRHGLLAECAELAAVAGPSVSIIRALDLLGDAAQAQVWAREVAVLETDILSKMLRDALPFDVVADRFSRVLYAEARAGDKPALLRYEKALRVFWQQALRSKSDAAQSLQGTAQSLLICAIVLDKADLAIEASKHLPDGPWRNLGRAWADDDHTALAQLERRFADDIAVEEESGGLSILSDTWAYLLLDRVRRRCDHSDGVPKRPLDGR